MILSIALAMIVVVVSLMTSDSPVQAEPPQRFGSDSGIIIPGPHQKVRLTITGSGEDLLMVQFRQMTYAQDVCNDGVCKSSIVSNQASAPMTLMPGEAASIDIPASFIGGVSVGVRAVVISNRRDVRVNAFVIDTISGQGAGDPVPTESISF